MLYVHMTLEVIDPCIDILDSGLTLLADRTNFGVLPNQEISQMNTNCLIGSREKGLYIYSLQYRI